MVCELNGNMVGGDWGGEDVSGLWEKGLAFFVKYGIISVVFSTSWNSSVGRALHS